MSAAAGDAARSGAGPQELYAQVMLRPMGTPLPMGFIALAASTTVFAVLQLGLLADDQGRIAALAVLALTVPLQGLAAVLGFFTRDAVAGTGMAVQAGTWAAVAVVTLATPAGAHSPGLGVVLRVSAAAQVMSAVAGMAKVAAALVMGLSAVRFAVTGVAELSGSTLWLTAAGVVGLVLGAAALFAALAFELETQGYRPLSIGRRIDDERGEQTLGSLSQEPGVRRRL